MIFQFLKLKMSVLLQISLLCLIEFASSQILFEELKVPIMHPRTFYLSPNQEFQVISKVLCEDIPCPEFSVVQDYPYFIQQRSYHLSKFLKLTSMRTCNFKSVLEDGRQRTEKYTKGRNNREEKYQKTLPFLIKIDQIATSKSKNPWCHMSYGANFYVPHYWGNIATPTEFLPEFLDLDENLQVYVHTFDGNVENVLLKEMELFRRNLDTLNLCYKKMTFYVAMYDVPHSPHDSRQELWFLKCTSK